MLNDSDDKFEGQDESEYHFSDDEVSYELEDESSKPSDASAEASVSTKKEGMITQFTQSKRMMVSVAVFLVLVVVVYKMVAPTSSSAPSTDIMATAAPVAAPTAPAPTLAQQQAAPQQAPQQAAAQTMAPDTQPMASIAPANQQPATQAAVQQLQASALPQLPAGIAASAQPAAQQAMAAAQSMVQSVTGSLPNQMAAVAQQQPQQQLPPPQVQAQQLVSTPPAIPVNPPTAEPSANQGPNTNTGNYIVQPGGNPDEKMATMAANSERLMGQLQGQYTQQYNEFSNQTRAVQDQMQTLNARVAVIEGQLSQLIQALTKRNANTSQNMQNTAPTRLEPQRQASVGRIAYNVQAIIPGRAWLKSDNGETVTVAEGDSIKGVGRVTKIDPYDGIVEINTGNKSVSLSYGDSA